MWTLCYKVCTHNYIALLKLHCIRHLMVYSTIVGLQNLGHLVYIDSYHKQVISIKISKCNLQFFPHCFPHNNIQLSVTIPDRSTLIVYVTITHSHVTTPDILDTLWTGGVMVGVLSSCRSWVQVLVGSNERLLKWYFQLLSPLSVRPLTFHILINSSEATAPI